ncbi:Uncharacterised protein [Mycobacteroides abscessus subsp. abscessus]|nr:Uncharacterised protein [Mycobacteroides abscessus subsp. abscessus]
MEEVDGARQLPAVHRIVELRDEVAQRAALMAERHPAVHAARGLPAQLVGIARLVDLAVVEEADGHRAALGQLAAGNGEESVRISHG